MPNIDPQRLRELRTSKGLSRQQIDGVSERHLARIEARDEPTRIRDHTLNKLANALGVPPGVITGEEPLPDGVGNSHGVDVHPRALRALRESKGMTHAKLAEESGVPARRIARLEASGRTIEPTAAEALATALGTDVETLSQDDLRLPSGPGRSTDPVRMAVKMSPQLRLAYDLIGHRYGPSRAEVVELAPLLFVLLAEGCLAWRRERLDEVWSVADRLPALREKASQLYFTRYLGQFETGAGSEQDSIDSADLLGSIIRDRGEASWDFYEDDLYAVTPFADYLRMLAEKLEIGGIVDFSPTESEATVGSDTVWGAEPYQICSDTLTELTGGSKHARWALAYGDVQLARIPPDLLQADAKERRINWLEEHLSEAVREEREDWERFWSELDSLLGKARPTPGKPSDGASGGSR